MNPAFVGGFTGGEIAFDPWQGLDFLWTDPNGKYVNIGDHNSFDAKAAMTWSFWINTPGYQGAAGGGQGKRERIYIRYWDPNDCEMIMFDDSSYPAGEFNVKVADGAANEWIGILSFANADFTLNEWQHVLITFEGGATRQVKIYINNVEKTWDSTASTPPNVTTTTGAYHFIGASAVNIEDTDSFKGKVSQFRIFIKAVDESIRNELYNGGAGLQSHYEDAELYLEYLFEDDEAANLVADTSGHGADCSGTKTASDPDWVNSDD